MAKADEVAKLGNPLVSALQKDGLRLRCGLNSKVFAGEILQGIDIAALVHGNDLTACYIRAGPLVIIQPSLHRKAAHDAVDSAALNEFLLFLPVDLYDLDPVAHSCEGLGGQLNINAGWVAVLIEIVVRRVAVTAQLYDRQVRRSAGAACRAAAGKERGCHKK